MSYLPTPQEGASAPHHNVTPPTPNPQEHNALNFTKEYPHSNQQYSPPIQDAPQPHTTDAALPPIPGHPHYESNQHSPEHTQTNQYGYAQTQPTPHGYTQLQPQGHHPYGSPAPTGTYDYGFPPQYTVSKPPGKAIGVLALIFSLAPEIIFVGFWLLFVATLSGNSDIGATDAYGFGIAFIIAAFGVIGLAPLGFVLGIIGVNVKQKPSGRILSIIAIVISSIHILFFVLLWGSAIIGS